MYGFQTKNSTYYMNNQDKTITGGFFGERIVTYKNARVVVGDRAVIELENNDTIVTGTVRNYL